MPNSNQSNTIDPDNHNSNQTSIDDGQKADTFKNVNTGIL